MKKWTRGRLWLLTIGGGVVALVLTAAGPFALRVWTGRAATSAEIARIRAAGEPVTPAEMRDYALALQPDAIESPPWLAALRSLDEVPYDDEETALADSRETVAKHAATLALLHAAAEADERARLVPSYRPDGLRSMSDTIEKFRLAVRLLRHELRVGVADGDGAAAARTAGTLLWLPRQFENLPGWLYLVFGHALHAQATVAVAHALPALPVDALPELAAADYSIGGQLHRSLLAEQVFGLAMFEAALAEMPAIEAAWQTGSRAEFLRLIAEYLAVADLPYGDAVAALQPRLDQERQLNALRGWGRAVEVNRTTAFEHASPDGFAKTLAAMARVAARRDAFRVAVAAERYRRATGEYPETAAALVPPWLDAVPADPFADRRLTYRRTEWGAIVYSIGPNGIDDGGEVGGWRRLDDVALRVGREPVEAPRPESVDSDEAWEEGEEPEE